MGLIWEEEAELYSADKTKSKKIIVKYVRNKDKKYFDIRDYIKSDDKLIPTSKGVTVPFDKVDDIYGAITEWKNKQGCD